MWLKKPVNIAVTVGAAILLVVVIVLLVWGITRHTEGGLLKVCWHNGIAVYTPEETETIEDINADHVTCDRTQELVWPQKQIPIDLAPLSAERKRLDADTPEVRALTQAAIDFNRQVGFEMYRVGAGFDVTDASVHFGGALQAGKIETPPGYVSHVRVGRHGPVRGYLYLRSDVGADTRILHLVLLHELGHLAGLRHDDFTLSIMYPIVRSDWFAPALSHAHVTDYDRKLLRQHYYRESKAVDYP